MSRRLIRLRKDGRWLELVLGYDRPLQELFLQVAHADDAGERADTSWIYDSAHEPHADWTRLATVCDALRRLGLVVPAEMLLAVWRDQRYQAGNLIVRHDAGRLPTTLWQG